jgi:hypothetical protein
LEEAMRKTFLLALALAAAAVATLVPAPQAEATTTCSWECGPCGLVCPCDYCKGPIPFCVCQAD